MPSHCRILVRTLLVRSLTVCAALLSFAGAVHAQQLPTANRGTDTSDLKVLSWNIWHGGREDGKEVGPARVIDVIRDSAADVVAMQETYGSGELIAKALGFHFLPRGTNVSIHSRYPILEDISVHKEFECVGALIELPNKTQVACYSIWLPYSAEIWAAGTRDTSKPEAMLAACKASHASLRTMWAAIAQRLSAPKYQHVPIVIAGDFNSMSHLDYGEIGWDQYHAVVPWQTSTILSEAGFVDSYRSCNPRIDRAQDSTWTPRFPEQEQDRIDFIYCRGARTQTVTVAAKASSVVREHRERFPSDHAALLSQLQIAHTATANTPKDLPIRVLSYNIRHGEGMDHQLNLERTAAAIRRLQPDFVGLQEVDLHTSRTSKVNQANQLGAMLKMQSAFGSFMPFQGGLYGMAVLSRYPIVNVESLRLPDGNEPRIALAVEALLPNGTTVLLVNVHFDWVEDDGFRFAQATMLAERLRKHGGPFVLLGDFNDGPDSRTLALFDQIAQRTVKPANDRLTFSSTKPEKEIDFIFCAPKNAWRIGRVEVIREPAASDHRPVVAELVLQAR
jgi:endonuclease/exonuclease/phosphatase family metal-dependent hydrolase